MQCVKKGSVGSTRLLPRAKMLLVPMNFFSTGRLCSGGFYMGVLTQQMCIIFASFFTLRGRHTHIDFRRFVSGLHDLPSDARAFTLTPFET